MSEKINCSTKNRYPKFFLAKIHLSICPNTYEFFRFFSNLRFFFISKKRSKVTKFGFVFPKNLRTTLKKFLNNQSKRLATTTQTFFDKRGFQKLEKNLKKFTRIWKNRQINFGKKNYVADFFTNNFFSSLIS